MSDTHGQGGGHGHAGDHGHGGGHGGMTADQATAAFAAAGFASVTGVAQHGGNWVGKSTDASGNAVTVVCHKDGRVTAEAE
jgi:hypothetical protein